MAFTTYLHTHSIPPEVRESLLASYRVTGRSTEPTTSEKEAYIHLLEAVVLADIDTSNLPSGLENKIHSCQVRISEQWLYYSVEGSPRQRAIDLVTHPNPKIAEAWNRYLEASKLQKCIQPRPRGHVGRSGSQASFCNRRKDAALKALAKDRKETFDALSCLFSDAHLSDTYKESLGRKLFVLFDLLDKERACAIARSQNIDEKIAQCRAYLAEQGRSEEEKKRIEAIISQLEGQKKDPSWLSTIDPFALAFAVALEVAEDDEQRTCVQDNLLKQILSHNEKGVFDKVKVFFGIQSDSVLNVEQQEYFRDICTLSAIASREFSTQYSNAGREIKNPGAMGYLLSTLREMETVGGFVNLQGLSSFAEFALEQLHISDPKTEKDLKLRQDCIEIFVSDMNKTLKGICLIDPKGSIRNGKYDYDDHKKKVEEEAAKVVLPKSGASSLVEQMVTLPAKISNTLSLRNGIDRLVPVDRFRLIRWSASAFDWILRSPMARWGLLAAITTYNLPGKGYIDQALGALPQGLTQRPQDYVCYAALIQLSLQQLWRRFVFDASQMSTYRVVNQARISRLAQAATATFVSLLTIYAVAQWYFGSNIDATSTEEQASAESLAFYDNSSQESMIYMTYSMMMQAMWQVVKVAYDPIHQVAAFAGEILWTHPFKTQIALMITSFVQKNPIFQNSVTRLPSSVRIAGRSLFLVVVAMSQMTAQFKLPMAGLHYINMAVSSANVGYRSLQRYVASALNTGGSVVSTIGSTVNLTNLSKFSAAGVNYISDGVSSMVEPLIKLKKFLRFS